MLKKYSIISILLALFTASPLFSTWPYTGHTSSYKKNAYLDDSTWHTITPYLFPETHPLKPKLDKIFSTRVSANITSMQQAGFKIIGKRVWDKALVAKHPELPGLIVKLYLDDHIGMDDKFFLINRIIGAEITRHAINTFGYQNYFVVPKKWLYPLPDHTHPLPEGERKFLVVIAEEIRLVSDSKNIDYFYKKMDKYRLEALYHLISTQGLSDAVFIKNIPFTKDGKNAFLDTERFHLWDIQYYKLLPYLSSKRQKEWAGFYK